MKTSQENNNRSGETEKQISPTTTNPKDRPSTKTNEPEKTEKQINPERPERKETEYNPDKTRREHNPDIIGTDYTDKPRPAPYTESDEGEEIISPERTGTNSESAGKK